MVEKKDVQTTRTQTKDVESDNLAPATVVTESGALMEDTIKQRIDLTAPAVDNEPRKGLPPESNQIDFNDPRTDDQIAAAKDA